MTKGKENGQNKPPKLYFTLLPSCTLWLLISEQSEESKAWEAYFVRTLSPLSLQCVQNLYFTSVCVNNSIAINLCDSVVQWSCYQFVCLSAPDVPEIFPFWAYTFWQLFSNVYLFEVWLLKSAPEIFPIEEISAQEYTLRWQPQVIRRMFCKCFMDQYRGRKTETYPNR